MLFYKIKIRIFALDKINTFRSVLGHVLSVVTAVLHCPYCLILCSQARSLKVTHE